MKQKNDVTKMSQQLTQERRTMMNLSKITKDIGIMLKKHSPEILTGLGVAGMITTTIMAVKATPKAIMLINEKEVEQRVEKLTPVETVKTVWKCYIPAVITGVASVACIIGASSVNAKRNAALATAYTLSETALKEYKDKVVETIGPKKEEEIRSAIAKDKLEKDPVIQAEVIDTGAGMTLCYDALSGRYFRSDVDKIRRAEYMLNRMILMEGYISLNDFYYEIGLDPIKVGDKLGWSSRQERYIDINFGSALTADQVPCLVIDFHVAPIYDYY